MSPHTAKGRVVLVVLTDRCNLQCSYCYQDRGSGRDMDWFVLRSSLSLLRGDGCRHELAFHGGEPLLALPLVRQALAELDARELGVDLSITTNGLLLDPKTVELFARRNVRVTLSCDGSKEAQELRAPGTHAELDRLLRRLAATQPDFLAAHVVVSMTVTAANVAHLATGVASLLERGVRRITLQPLKTPDPGWGPRPLALLKQELDKVAALVADLAGSTGRISVTNLAGRQPRARSRLHDGWRCNAVRARNLVVDVDGGVYPCLRVIPSVQRLPDSWHMQPPMTMRIGHVTEPDLEARIVAYRDRARTLLQPASPGRGNPVAPPCGDCALCRSCPLCPLSPALQGGTGQCFECDFERTVASRRRLVRAALASRRQALRPPRVPPRLRRLLPQSASPVRAFKPK